eukprot:ANDGO_00379.mRNA.1 hypothetical protein
MNSDAFFVEDWVQQTSAWATEQPGFPLPASQADSSYAFDVPDREFHYENVAFTDNSAFFVPNGSSAFEFAAKSPQQKCTIEDSQLVCAENPLFVASSDVVQPALYKMNLLNIDSASRGSQRDVSANHSRRLELVLQSAPQHFVADGCEKRPLFSVSRRASKDRASPAIMCTDDDDCESHMEDDDNCGEPECITDVQSVCAGFMLESSWEVAVHDEHCAAEGAPTLDVLMANEAPGRPRKGHGHQRTTSLDSVSSDQSSSSTLTNHSNATSDKTFVPWNQYVEKNCEKLTSSQMDEIRPASTTTSCSASHETCRPVYMHNRKSRSIRLVITENPTSTLNIDDLECSFDLVDRDTRQPIRSEGRSCLVSCRNRVAGPSQATQFVTNGKMERLANGSTAFDFEHFRIRASSYIANAKRSSSSTEDVLSCVRPLQFLLRLSKKDDMCSSPVLSLYSPPLWVHGRKKLKMMPSKSLKSS